MRCLKIMEKYLSYQEAKEFVKELNLKSHLEWKEYVKSNKADKIKKDQAINNVFWDGKKWGGSSPTSGNWMPESKN